MAIALILLSLAALCLGIFGWLWLCAGLRRGGWRGAVGIAAVQVSGLCLVYGVLRGQPMAGLFAAMFPPLGIAQWLSFAEYPGLLKMLARTVAPWSAAVLALALIWSPLRVWAVGMAALTALVGAVVLGDRAVEQAMCLAAKPHGLAAFSRMSLADSLAQDRERQVTPHAFAETGAGQLAWSYRLMNWYVLPEGKGINPPGLAAACEG